MKKIPGKKFPSPSKDIIKKVNPLGPLRLHFGGHFDKRQSLYSHEGSVQPSLFYFVISVEHSNLHAFECVTSWAHEYVNAHPQCSVHVHAHRCLHEGACIRMRSCSCTLTHDQWVKNCASDVWVFATTRFFVFGCVD